MSKDYIIKIEAEAEIDSFLCLLEYVAKGDFVQIEEEQINNTAESSIVNPFEVWKDEVDKYFATNKDSLPAVASMFFKGIEGFE